MSTIFDHDYTHCLDYKKGECPEDCFRAEVTQELLDDEEFCFPVAWANFKGTEECIIE